MSRPAGAPQSGQTLVVFALVLSLVLAALAALVADAGALYVAYDRADDAALLAAQAGASAIAAGSAYGGRLELSPGLARQRCEGSLAAAGVGGSCAATTASEVTAKADLHVLLPLPLPLSGAALPVEAVRHARPVYGDRVQEVPG